MTIHAQLDRNLFEIAIVQKRLRWDWSVRDRRGKVVMAGREKSRAAARYHSGRALFLLLLTTCPRLKPA
ncbi:MAG: hypothetical protein JOZ74_00090 [Bradyrhizobium sp.]|nr:hypothetical protein [Bradyrhizobium sp.]